MAEDSKADLGQQGITGLKYIELSRGSRNARVREPGEEIPPGTSLFDNLAQKADQIASKVNDGARSRGRPQRAGHEEAHRFACSRAATSSCARSTRCCATTARRWRRWRPASTGTAEQARMLTTELAATAKRANGLLAEATVMLRNSRGTPAQLNAFLEQGTALLKESRGLLGPEGLQRTVARINTFLGQTQQQVVDTIGLLRETAENASALTEKLRDDPSLLLLGSDEEDELRPTGSPRETWKRDGPGPGGVRWALVLCLLAACGSPAPRHYFTLTGQMPAARFAQPFPIRLRVRDLEMRRSYRRDELVVRADANEITFLRRQRWSEPPQRMISALIREQVRRSGISAEVQDDSGLGEPDFVLGGEIEAIEQLSAAERSVRPPGPHVQAAPLQGRRRGVELPHRRAATGQRDVVALAGAQPERDAGRRDRQRAARPGPLPRRSERAAPGGGRPAAGAAPGAEAAARRDRPRRQPGAARPAAAPARRHRACRSARARSSRRRCRTATASRWSACSRNGRLVTGKAKLGRRIVVAPGDYEVRVGSGAGNQQLTRKVRVEAGKTTVVPPAWAELDVNVVDETFVPFRGTYEIIRMEKREDFGLGFGADEQLGEVTRVWVLPPGLYKIIRAGGTYRDRTDFATVRLEAGRLTRFTLVLDPDDGRFLGAGENDPDVDLALDLTDPALGADQKTVAPARGAGRRSQPTAHRRDRRAGGVADQLPRLLRRRRALQEGAAPLAQPARARGGADAAAGSGRLPERHRPPVLPHHLHLRPPVLVRPVRALRARDQAVHPLRELRRADRRDRARRGRHGGAHAERCPSGQAGRHLRAVRAQGGRGRQLPPAAQPLRRAGRAPRLRRPPDLRQRPVRVRGEPDRRGRPAHPGDRLQRRGARGHARRPRADHALRHRVRPSWTAWSRSRATIWRWSRGATRSRCGWPASCRSTTAST